MEREPLALSSRAARPASSRALAPSRVIDESRALTGLRGLAALLVLAHHVALHLNATAPVPASPGPLYEALRKGYLGVDLFFVLSGFVMCMVYGSQFHRLRRSSGWDYLAFLVRRVARIWPLHAVVLATVLTLLWLRGIHPFTPRVIVENLLLIQAWGHSTEINPPAWSISTELAAYLLFPLLAGLVLHGRLRPILCAVGVAAALALCMHYAPPIGPMRRGELDIYYNFSPLPTLRCLAGFVTGMLAWRAGQLAPVRALASTPWLGPAALAAMLALMLAAADDRIIFLLLPIIVLGLHCGSGPVHRALAAAPLHALGVLSYAIYLIHYLLLAAFPFLSAPLPLVLPAYLATVLAFAATAHALIERPVRRLVRTLGARSLAALRHAASGRGTPLQERAP